MVFRLAGGECFLLLDLGRRMAAAGMRDGL